MLLLTLQLSWTEIIILQIGALILGCTIYFFYTSRRSLQQTMQGGCNLQTSSARKSLLEEPVPREVMGNPLQVVRSHAVKRPETQVSPLSSRDLNKEMDDLRLKTNIQPAPGTQATISALMQRVEQLEALSGTRQLSTGTDLQHRIAELEEALAEKTAALKQARQQETIAQQMSSRMEEVFREFEQLQDKMVSLEAQAATAQEQAIELDDLQRAYHLLQKDLVRKQDKLDELVDENQRLQLELAAAADKLHTADQQRQQLTQRSRAMQDMQMDMEAISEGQSKLQQQLRRISELEVMLEQFGGKQRK